MSIKRVLYHKSCIELFTSEIEKFGTIETGGVLLGKIEPDAVVVFKAIGPGPNAIHENFYFRADANYIDMIIDIEYANSNGEIVYLGEWHTHPQIIPEPSELDLISLGEITVSSTKPNLLLILGAIGFNQRKFSTQSISIIKLPDQSKFYSFEAEVLTE